ncbi:MAG: hypothetical protein GXO55_04255 [Chloroflexi bacterium]|nr:hypothetical protein [Chloroflexota bacterium]
MGDSPIYWIDWGWLARQIPWIIGASLLLATLSWGDWAARVRRVPRRHLFSRPPYSSVILLSLALIAVGFALNPTHPWEPYVAGGLALLLGVQALREMWHHTRASHSKENSHA